jgi:hypothetical protein
VAPTDVPGAARPCAHGHGTALAEELRALALVALDRLDPLLARLRAVVDGPARDAPDCAVCAALAAVRAERPELTGRLAAHATGLAAALREALGDRSAATPADTAEAPVRRPVQRIPVDRVPRRTSC